jgi:hypothetical protein
MKKKLFVLTLSISMLSALVFGQALAGSVSFSGTLDLSDLKQTSLAWTGCVVSDLPPNPPYPDPLWYFETYQFKVTETGSYDFIMTQPVLGHAPAPTGWAWTNITLYNGQFTPGDPGTHCVDGGNIQTFGPHNLVKDVVYTIVVFADYEGPNWTQLGPYMFDIRGPGDIILLPNPDDRINWDSGLAGPVALYCNDDVLDVWLIDLGSGEGIYQFSFDAWDDTAPDTNTLVKSVGATELWHLTTGEYQLNLAYSPEYGVWKGYAFLFNGCPYDGNGYTNNFDANQ